MNVAIYLRVSTQIQAQDGNFIAERRDFLTNYAKSENWDIVEFYIDEGYSPNDLERPDLNRLRDDAKQQKFDMVLVHKMDQFTRSIQQLNDLLKEFSSYGIKVKSVTEKNFDSTTTMGDFLINIASAMSEVEAEGMLKRLLSNRKNSSNQEKHYPYGYDQDGEVIAVEKEIIQRIAKLYMDGSDYESIATILNEEGKLHRELPWNSSLISQTLENPFYTGLEKMISTANPSEYIYVKGDHEAILTEEELKR